jgi:microcin C transport system permease protein
VLARVIYGFRLSVSFALVVTFLTSVIGIAAGAAQGYFGGVARPDLPADHRDLEFDAQPLHHHHHIRDLHDELLAAGVPDGAVRLDGPRGRGARGIPARAELRIRPRGAGAGRGQRTIMFRHVLPNAMVATLTFLPFIVTGTIGALASLDFLGFGLPSSAPSLGEMTLQAKNNLNAPWLGFTAFFTFAIMLSLLVFVFEGVRDAFDPRKTFSAPAPAEDTGDDIEPVAEARQ